MFPQFPGNAFGSHETELQLCCQSIKTNPQDEDSIMNATDSPIFQQDDIEKLKHRLASFCGEKQISKFDADDIVELLEDGESVEWLMEQLKGDVPDLDVASTSELLANIRRIVGPEDKPVETESEEATGETESGTPDLSEADLSQIDMSKLRSMLPKGMQLPPGMGVKQLQQIMESPKAKIMTDMLAFCREQGVDMDAMNDPQQMQELEEHWKNMPRPAFDGKTPAEMLAADPTLAPSKVETYHREEPRIGRNDPCPCGSGKKYKKCCGRAK
jgi:uncharacterized protein YecA (UPF0149 family)